LNVRTLGWSASSRAGTIPAPRRGVARIDDTEDVVDTRTLTGAVTVVGAFPNGTAARRGDPGARDLWVSSGPRRDRR
jgi:hypothetical protein